jgi:methylmalonyl-CoA mutase N-terminal domain/subunit
MRPPTRVRTQHRSTSSFEVKQSYGPKDLPSNLSSKLGQPGSYPYTRGIHPDMYRGRLWSMRQYAGFGSARETNARYRFLLQQGVTGLSVAFDLPTQMGRDPDHLQAQAEIGRVGVSISCLDDMRDLLRDIPLDRVSISMTINSTAPIILAMLLVVAQERKISWKKLQGTVQNDLLKEYLARGTYIFPPAPALRLVTDLIEFCANKVPQWNSISISGYHMREAGCSAAQELGFTFSNAIGYLDLLRERGIAIDSVAPRLAFFFNAHSDFLEEVAKFRAARRLWAEIVKKRYQANNPRSMMLRFHTQTAGSTLSAQQPMVNVVRTTLQALSAVLGGTQSLHTNAYDEALSLPCEESAELALRTQQVLAYESGITNSVDPFAGSYLVENWTQRLFDQAHEYIQRIDAMGGMLVALERGFPQAEIEAAAYRFQKQVEAGERKIVGVNCFESPLGVPTAAPQDFKQVERKIASSKRFKRAHQGPAKSRALRAVQTAARKGSNVMPAILRAVKAQATLGEISDALRGVFGEYARG